MSPLLRNFGARSFRKSTKAASSVMADAAAHNEVRQARAARRAAEAAAVDDDTSLWYDAKLTAANQMMACS